MAFFCTPTLKVVGAEIVPGVVGELVAPAGAPGMLLVAPGAGITVSKWISGETAPGAALPVPTTPVVFTVVLLVAGAGFVVVLVVPGAGGSAVPGCAGCGAALVVAGAGVLALVSALAPVFVPEAGEVAVTEEPDGGAAGVEPLLLLVCANADAAAKIRMTIKLRRCMGFSLQRGTKGVGLLPD
jgi:hypothetical protein